MGQTERFLQIDRYEAHYRGLQYNHQKHDWWGRPAADVETIQPIQQVPPGFVTIEGLLARDKKPTAPANLVRSVIERFTDLLFGDARRPKVGVSLDPDTEAGLDEIIKQTDFWGTMTEARNLGGGCGAVAITAHVNDGRFALEIHNAKHVTPVWKNKGTWTPLAYLISYTYLVPEQNFDDKGHPDGVKMQEYLYRRIVTEAQDLVYKPLKIEPNVEIVWEVDEALSVDHNLGFFPGVWIQNERNSAQHDGDPDCEGGWGMSDSYDRLVSQMLYGTINNLDPTVSMSYDPKEVQSGGGLRKGSSNALHLGKGGTAGYMEMAGSGVTTGERVLTILKNNFLDLVRCVLIDPEKLSGSAQSGYAISLLYGPMLARADKFRRQYGNGAVKLLEILAEIASQQGKIVELEDGQKGVISLDLPKRSVQNGDTVEQVDHVFKPSPAISLTWPQYFAPTEDDRQKRIANANTAKTGHLIASRTATEYVAEVFGVTDVDAEQTLVTKEAADELEQMSLDNALTPQFP